MSTPTAREIAFAKRMTLDPNAVAAAREVFNIISLLPWPRPERISLLERLARSVHADVGSVLGGKAIDIAPLESFDDLLPILGIADKRTAGLVRALAKVDVSTLTLAAENVKATLVRVASLEVENAALRQELDHLYVSSSNGSGSKPNVMTLDELSSSISSQVASAAGQLRSLAARGLKLSNVQLSIRGAATTVAQDVALDLGATSATSEVNLAYLPAGTVAATVGIAVPDVRGYTPSLAQRKLTAVGLAATFAALNGAQGAVAEQSPAVGTVVQAGTLVRLIVR